MDAIPFISILVLVFALILMTELFKLKREVRKSTNLSNRIKKDLIKLKEEIKQK